MQWVWSWLARSPHLADWQSRPFSSTVELGPRENDRRDCYERVVAVESIGPPELNRPHRRVANAIFAYRIFPPRLVTPILKRTPIEIGDTVGVCYHFLPGIDVFFAARVTFCFDESRDGTWHTGFTYRTLAGHPESGEETFSVEKNMANGKVLVALRSWSRPGTFLTKLIAPYTRHAQVRASNSALYHLAAIANSDSSKIDV